ncbi:MAG: hypothetical protein K6E51_07500 [Treponema sp.]|nr:hypothetical protein [Treponema sp.]
MPGKKMQCTMVKKAVKAAVRESGIIKKASCHTFRHSFASCGAKEIVSPLDGIINSNDTEF